MNKRKPVVSYLDSDIIDKLRFLSYIKNVGIAQLLREAVDLYLSQEENFIPEKK